jgi:hypothetical protein
MMTGRIQFLAFALATTICAFAGAQAALTETPDTITGSSQKIDAAKQLTQAEIRTLALDYLRGWKLGEAKDGSPVWSYREMYQIATAFKGEPGLSSVEFMLDPSTMRLYASSEKGTEKVEHIKYNDRVVLYWYKQIQEDKYMPGKNDYFNSWGVQIKGKARLMTAADPKAKDIAAAYMNTLYGEKKWGDISADKKAATLDRLFQVNEWIEVIPSEYVVNSLNWSYNKEKSSRPEWYDPKSPFFGKSVRQVYYVK